MDCRIKYAGPGWGVGVGPSASGWLVFLLPKWFGLKAFAIRQAFWHLRANAFGECFIKPYADIDRVEGMFYELLQIWMAAGNSLEKMVDGPLIANSDITPTFSAVTPS